MPLHVILLKFIDARASTTMPTPLQLAWGDHQQRDTRIAQCETLLASKQWIICCPAGCMEDNMVETMRLIAQPL